MAGKICLKIHRGRILSPSVYFSQTTMFLRGKVSLAIFKIKEPREEDGNLKLLFSWAGDSVYPLLTSDEGQGHQQDHITCWRQTLALHSWASRAGFYMNKETNKAPWIHCWEPWERQRWFLGQNSPQTKVCSLPELFVNKHTLKIDPVPRKIHDSVSCCWFWSWRY